MGDRPNFKTAYDSRTGRKLPNKVPAQFFKIFPHLRETPKSQARSNTNERSE